MTFLEANGEFDAGAAFGYLDRHAVPGVDVVDREAGRLTRALPTADGPIAVSLSPRSDGILVSAAGTDRHPPIEVIRLVRAWFDLDTDLEPIDQVLSSDPVLAELGRTWPGLRVLGYPDGFEATIATVLGQQVSVRAAGTFAGRLSAAYGAEGPAGLTLFPGPRRLAATPVDELQAAVGVTGSRARTVLAVARLFADGFRLDAGGATRETRDALLALPGIGPWTVDYLSMRVLHDPDAYPAGDLVLRRALGLDRAVDVVRRAERWRPYRAYAVMRLWTAAVTGRPIPPSQGRG